MNGNVSEIDMKLIDYKSFEDFVKDCASNWDCDTGANGSHPYYCRKCNAEKLLKTAEEARTREPNV